MTYSPKGNLCGNCGPQFGSVEGWWALQELRASKRSFRCCPGRGLSSSQGRGSQLAYWKRLILKEQVWFLPGFGHFLSLLPWSHLSQWDAGREQRGLSKAAHEVPTFGLWKCKLSKRPFMFTPSTILLEAWQTNQYPPSVTFMACTFVPGKLINLAFVSVTV